MRKNGSQGPTMLETIRLDLTVFERAVAAGDIGTAKRSVDAAEAMFRSLRDIASGQGCDVGPSVWHDTPVQAPEELSPLRKAIRAEGERMKAAELPVEEYAATVSGSPAIPPPPMIPEETRIEELSRKIELSQRIDELSRRVDEVRAARRAEPPLPSVPAWLGRLERREWSWRVLARLTWAWVCCAAALSWRGVRRVFGRRNG
jgi:hypothetical protein